MQHGQLISCSITVSNYHKQVDIGVDVSLLIEVLNKWQNAM